MKKSPKPSRGRWLWLGFGLTGVAMLSATAGALLAVSLSSTPLMQSKLSPEDEAVFSGGDLTRTDMRLPQLTRPVNILILGTKVLTSDLEEPPEDELGYHALVNSLDGLSDTMLMVRFNPSAEQLSVLSIPRDTRTRIEGVGTTKINEANYYGGPALSAKAVSELLGGVGIDRYVRVNVQAVEKLVDALGGVTVYVPHDMKYQDDSQHLYINLKAGKQHLNGSEALQFLRYRYDNMGDIGRIQRQQLLMRAMIEQTLDFKTLMRLPKILSVIQEHIDTNLSIEELVALAGFASDVSHENVEMLMLPGDFNNPENYDEVSYWLPNYARIDAMMAEHFDRGMARDDYYRSLDPAYMRIAIQDSTGSPEAIDALIDTLYDAGYHNVFVSQSWSEPLEETRIVAQYGDIESARALRRTLGLGDVRVESTGSLQSDVTIQVGEDWLQQQEPFLQSARR
jgi:LCP family protein required for cell wall assembly